MTEEEIHLAIQAYQQDLIAIQKVAAMFHSSATTLSRIFKERGIHIRTKDENTEIRLHKFKQTNLKKYGCENPSQAIVIKEKKKQTCLNHYGVENALQSSIIKEKVRQTNLKKYGHVNTFQNYNGVNPFTLPEVQIKIKETLLNRYGVDNPQKSVAIQEKTKQTNLKKYGVRRYTNSKKIKETMIKRYGESYGKMVAEKIKSLGSMGRAITEAYADISASYHRIHRKGTFS